MDEEPEGLAQRLSADDDSVTTMVGHYYRGEMDRVNEWRNRLDQTTTWAVTIMAAILTWAFSSRDNPHYLLLIAVLTVVLLLVIDVRRYRTYDVWRSRLRILEQDVFAGVIDPESTAEHEDWRTDLADDLRQPTYKVPVGEAYGRRLRRVYLPLLLVLLAAWIVRVSVYEPQESVLETASVFAVPGWLVVAGVGLAYAAAVAVAFWPRDRQAKGELYEQGEEGEWKD